jgi:hypothetical protein
MQTNTFILITISILLSIPLGVPVAATIKKSKYLDVAQDIIARYAVISISVLSIVTAYFWGLRFESHAANIVVLLSSLVCYLSLISIVYKIKPRLLGIPLASAIVAITLIITFGTALSFAVDDKSNQIRLASNLHCEVFQFGFAGDQGGLDVSIYKDLGVGIKRRVFHDGYLDEINYPFQNQEQACNYARTKINQ